MSTPRRDVVVKLDAEMHEGFTAICDRDGINYGKQAEILITKFVMDELHKFSLSKQSFANLRILKNLEENR